VTHVLARAAEMLKVLTLTTGNINTLATSANLASIQQELTPINNRLRDGVRYGITDDAPAARIVGIDSRFGIERVVEAGSEISETERWITSQQEILTFSMNEAYANIDVNAVRILRLDA
jgi:antitoxin (DNA-binding transcriptional repressor) of toxin-antitoxin stability system